MTATGSMELPLLRCGPTNVTPSRPSRPRCCVASRPPGEAGAWANPTMATTALCPQYYTPPWALLFA